MGPAQLGEIVTAHGNGAAQAAVRLQAAWRGHLAREDMNYALLRFPDPGQAQHMLRDFYARGISWDKWHAGRRRVRRQQQERDAAAAAAAHSSSLVHALPSPPTTSSLTVPLAHAGCNDPHLTVSTLEQGRHERGEDRDRRANFLTRALSVEHPAAPRREEYQEESAQRAAARAPRALSLGIYGRRPPGIHSHHAAGVGESDGSESGSDGDGGCDSESGGNEDEEDEAAACARAEAEADERALDASERLCELKQSVTRWLLTDAGWSAEEVEASCTVHGESDVDAPGFYWTADDICDPFWWSGYGFRMAGTFATLCASGLHIDQLPPRTPAQMRRLRAAWAQAARVDADASTSRGTAMRAARRSAEAEAEKEAAAEEDELLLGCI